MKTSVIVKKISLLAAAGALALSLAACDSTASAEKIRISALKGPTGMGMVQLMSDDEKLDTPRYEVGIYGTADEIVSQVVGGTVDIANVPCNIASVLYNKTEGGVMVAAINTLNTLYIVESGETIHSFADLAGKTIYTTGKGSTPQYVLEKLMAVNNITDQVTVEYLSESTEVATKLSGDTSAIALLPQPYISIAQTQNANLRMALNMGEEWANQNLGQLITGVTVVSRDFAENHQAELDAFLTEYAYSGEYANQNIDATSALIGGYDIVPEAVAKKALPYCGISVIITDEKNQLITDYLNILHEFNPQAVGGTVPGDDFFYNI
jgi:NitT/TauT family transport system substrate-binding protein